MGAVRWPRRSCLPGRSVDVPLEPDSTPGRETLRHRWWDRRAGDRRHPRQRLLRYEIRTRPRVGDDRLSQIGSAVATEIAAVADLGPELLGRVRSAARLAERHRMVRTRREEQRSESDEQHHGARIVVLEARACQAEQRSSLVKGVDSVDNSRPSLHHQPRQPQSAPARAGSPQPEVIPAAARGRVSAD